jgi:hypothetical protein
MGLDLSKYLDQTEEITFKGHKQLKNVVLKVSSDIPDDMIFQFSELKEMNTDKFGREEWKKVIDMTKKLLCLKSAVDDVELVFRTLNFLGKVKIVEFVAEYIKNSMTNLKKKTN